MTVTKEMLMGEILNTDKAEVIADILMQAGMHCVGCPSAQMESLEEACAVHGINVDEVITKINEVIK